MRQLRYKTLVPPGFIVEQTGRDGAELRLWRSFGADNYTAPMTLAWSMSIFPRPYIWRFTSLSLVICPSVWPLDQGRLIAAATAAKSLVTPAANDATKLAWARASQDSRSTNDLLRIIPWKAAMTSRASSSGGTPSSITATVAV